jgi:hypothetical protein
MESATDRAGNRVPERDLTFALTRDCVDSFFIIIVTRMEKSVFRLRSLPNSIHQHSKTQSRKSPAAGK